MKVQRKAGPGAEQLRVMLAGLSDKVARVGFFPSSKYEDGTPVAYVAAIQEFGSPTEGIPPRSFMRTTAEAQRGAWQATARQGAQAVVKGNATGEQVLDTLGQLAAGDIRKAISDLTSPPLSQITIELRKMRREGRKITGKTVGEAAKATKSAFYQPVDSGAPIAKPLVESAVLLDAVTSEVGDK